MIFCIIAYCGGTDLRDINCLSLISDVGMDSKVAGYAHDQGKACIIAVNKWDAVEKDSYTMD